MKSSKNTITTQSTIFNSKEQIYESSFILPCTIQTINPSLRLKPYQRSISILTQNNSNLNFTKTISQQYRQDSQQKVNKKTSYVYESQRTQRSDMKILMSLEKILFKKKRYCFQVLKQFYLFPDQSQSSITSLSTYDPLIFKDQIIHSMVKKLQTKTIQNKIWGFINLRMMPYLKAAVQIQQKATKIYQKTLRINKKISFDMIKKTSEDAFSAIMKQSHFIPLIIKTQSESKSVQCSVKQNKRNLSNCLSSRLIEEQVKPSIKVTPQNESSSFDKVTQILSRQEYNEKYKISTPVHQNYEHKIIRISANEYNNKIYETKTPQIKITQARTSTYQAPVSQIRYVQKSNHSQYQNKQKSQKINKYNIIHYHERPRQIVHRNKVLLQEYQYSSPQTQTCDELSCSNCSNCSIHHNCISNSKKFINIRCQNSSRCMNSSCIENSCGTQCNNYCKKNKIPVQRCKNIESMNKTSYTQNVNFSQGKYNFSINQKANYQLSQLESRIQYLNFLRKVVQQQQNQNIP